MRKLFEYIRKLVEKRYRVRELNTDQPSDLPWQSVSAFCFLRFIVPAVLHPHLFGLVAGTISRDPAFCCRFSVSAVPYRSPRFSCTA
jgi:hypothetical protein